MAKKSSRKSSSKVEKVVEAEALQPFEEADFVEEAELVEAEVVEEVPAKSDDDFSADEGLSADEDATVEEEVVAPLTELSEPMEAIEEPIPPQVEEPKRSGGGFVPMLFGGIVAGGIGFAIATYLNSKSDQVSSMQIESLEQEISDLKGLVDQIPEPVDLSNVEQQISALGSKIDEVQADNSSAAAMLSDRIDIVEKQPSGDGTLQETAIAAYERDIQALRAQLAEQQSSMEAMMSATTERLQAAQNEATAIEEQTIASAKAATARSAIARIQTALDSGAAFGAVLAELTDVVDDPIPDALAAAKDGVLTLSSLTSEFPEPAREALAIARAEGQSGEDSSGISSFLKNQFSVRSVEPQEGASADAILSRAQGALQEGRLNDALSEVAGLPEVSRAALSDWVANAELRAAAVDAASAMFTKYNTN